MNFGIYVIMTCFWSKVYVTSVSTLLMVWVCLEEKRLHFQVQIWSETKNFKFLVSFYMCYTPRILGDIYDSDVFLAKKIVEARDYLVNGLGSSAKTNVYIFKFKWSQKWKIYQTLCVLLTHEFWVICDPCVFFIEIFHGHLWQPYEWTALIRKEKHMYFLKFKQDPE